jgi:hypothetical protein
VLLLGSRVGIWSFASTSWCLALFDMSMSFAEDDATVGGDVDLFVGRVSFGDGGVRGDVQNRKRYREMASQASGVEVAGEIRSGRVASSAGIF